MIMNIYIIIFIQAFAYNIISCGREDTISEAIYSVRAKQDDFVVSSILSDILRHQRSLTSHSSFSRLRTCTTSVRALAVAEFFLTPRVQSLTNYSTCMTINTHQNNDPLINL